MLSSLQLAQDFLGNDLLCNAFSFIISVAFIHGGSLLISFFLAGAFLFSCQLRFLRLYWKVNTITKLLVYVEPDNSGIGYFLFLSFAVVSPTSCFRRSHLQFTTFLDRPRYSVNIIFVFILFMIPQCCTCLLLRFVP